MVTAPAVMNYAQAAAYLGLPTAGALRTMVYRRRGPPSVSYGIRDRRFRVVDLDRWLAGKAAAAVPAEPPPRRRPGRPTKAEAAARAAR